MTPIETRGRAALHLRGVVLPQGVKTVQWEIGLGG